MLHSLRLAMLAALAATSFALAACKVEQQPQPTHRGLYVGGRELNSFRPCGVDSLYWVEGNAKSALQTRYNAIARRPFQPIYVELKAQVVPRGNQMPTEGHAGNIRVDTVLTATNQVPLECRPKGADPRDF